jgi:D-beta-D-heptose 7-phosphate kinase/D-beta-D-heptose 1-phosphate adenosyltransferase
MNNRDMKHVIVLITGGFDPIHSGHIAYINAAKKLGNHLIVGINSDEWLKRKKGKSFLSFNERKIILENLRAVDEVIGFDDSDDSAKDAIYQVAKKYSYDYSTDSTPHIIFANGGDRTGKNIPEMDVDVDNVSFMFGVGGKDKKNSSSWILNNWQKTDGNS